LPRLVPFPVRGPSKGYVKNLAPSVIDDRLLVLTGGLNVRNRLGGVELFPGWKKFDDTALTGTPLLLGNYRKSDGSRTLVCLTHQKAYSWNTVTSEFDNITRQTGSPAADSDYTAAASIPWSACVYRDTLIATNGADVIQKWTGTGKMAALGGTPPKAKVVLPFMNHLLLGSVNDGTAYPDKLVWSAQDNAEDWTAASGSGEVRTTDYPGEIRAILPIGDNLAVVYKDDSWYTLQYVGPPWYFKVRPAEPVGILSQRAVAAIRGAHFLIGKDNIYINNGLRTEPIGDPIRDEFFSMLNPDYVGMAFVHVDHDARDVYFCIPTTGNTYPNRAYIYNYEQQAWSPPIDFPATCVGEWTNATTLTIDSMTAAIDSYILPIDSALTAAGARITLFGQSDSYIRQIDPGLTTRDGAAYVGEAEFKPVQAGGIRRKRVLQAVAEVEDIPTAGLPVHIGTMDKPDGSLVWHGWGSLTPDGNPWLYGDAMGRYVAVRFRSESSDRLWRVNGYDLRHVPQGER
jgi:hypothetical protein